MMMMMMIMMMMMMIMMIIITFYICISVSTVSVERDANSHDWPTTFGQV